MDNEADLKVESDMRRIDYRGRVLDEIRDELFGKSPPAQADENDRREIFPPRHQARPDYEVGPNLKDPLPKLLISDNSELALPGDKISKAEQSKLQVSAGRLADAVAAAAGDLNNEANADTIARLLRQAQERGNMEELLEMTNEALKEINPTLSLAKTLDSRTVRGGYDFRSSKVMVLDSSDKSHTKVASELEVLSRAPAKRGPHFSQPGKHFIELPPNPGDIKPTKS